jgi:homoserine dehydrogenase
VVADLVDVARGNRTPVFSIPVRQLTAPQAVARGALVASFYLHLRVLDEPGVIAAISESLRDQEISIENLVQRGEAADGGIDVILTTHETREDKLIAAVDKIASLRTVLSRPVAMRMIRT